MKPHRAFTLIELLVVIAIIGILASLLLPTLGSAKNQAGKATDLNNLRQIMFAMNLYASENSDVMPAANWDAGGGTLPGWLYTPDSSHSFKLETGLLQPILKAAAVYVCPNDNLQMSHWSNRDQKVEQRPQRLSSYAINGAVAGYSWQWEHANQPPKMAQMLPGDCAFWETDETEPAYFNDGANYPPEGVSGRHLAGGIQAAFGGSGSYIKLAQWYAEDVTNALRNRLWCNPNAPDGHATPGYTTP